MCNKTFRLVICLDVSADSLEDAYETVYKQMAKLTTTTKDMDWESSDEWFDQDGVLGDPDTLQEARMRVINKLNS